LASSKWGGDADTCWVACVPSFTHSLCISLCLFVPEEIKRKSKGKPKFLMGKNKKGTITTPKQRIFLKFYFFFFFKRVDLIMGFFIWSYLVGISYCKLQF